MTDGGIPVTMLALFTFVNDGKAPRTRPRYPCAAIRARLGIRSFDSDTLKYSSAQPSIQITTTGFAGGLKAKVALLTLEGIGVDGDRPNDKVHPEVIPLDL